MQRRDAVLRAMKGYPISQRRACVLIGVDPKTVRRERLPDSPEIREEMRKIAEKRRRFGYRRIGIMLERKGMVMNEKKLYRLYKEEGLSVRRRRSRKRARGSRTPMPMPLQPNQRWSLDFLSDTFGALPEAPHPGSQRRLLPREPCPDCRYQYLRDQGGAGTRRLGQDLWKTDLHRQ